MARAISRWVDVPLAPALLVAQVIAWRLPFLGTRLYSDPGLFAYIARGILGGGAPYRDFFDNKPPFIYYSGALFTYLLGDSALAFWAQEVIFVSVTACVVYALLRRVLPPPASLLLGSLFIIFSNVSVFCGFVAGFVEFPAAMFTALAYFATVRGNNRCWHLLGGAAVWFAIMSQQLALIACAPLWLWLVAARRYRELLVHGLAMGALTLAFFAWYESLGAWRDFVYWVATYNWYYIKVNPSHLDPRRLPWLLYLGTPLPLLLYLAPRALRTDAAARLIYLWLTAVMATFLLSGWRLYAHYFVALAPPLTLALGYGWAALGSSRRALRGAVALAAVCAVAFAVLLRVALHDYAGRTMDRLRATSADGFQDPLVRAETLVARYHYPAGRRYVLCLGIPTAAELALRTNTTMPGRITLAYRNFMIDHPRRAKLAREWAAAVKAAEPSLVLQLKSAALESELPPGLADWVRRHYREKVSIGPYVVLERKRPIRDAAAS